MGFEIEMRGIPEEKINKWVTTVLLPQAILFRPLVVILPNTT
jgi:hypothetical protein